MRTLPSPVLLSLPFLLVSFTATAAEYEKNGEPCVSEICIGDGLTDIAKVKWDRAANNAPMPTNNKPLYTSARKTSELDKTLAGKLYKGFPVKSVAFLVDKQFDNEAIPLLAQVKAACGQNVLYGTYTTSSGNQTRVGIAMLPESTPATQSWRVISINRQIPSAVTDAQISEATAELKSRYANFDIAKVSTPKPGQTMFNINYSKPFGFQINKFLGLQINDQLQQHQLCGGSGKAALD